MAGRRKTYERGFTKDWQKARFAYLAANPICSEPGCTAKARHVHHTTMHKGDAAIVWDQSTWRGLCAEHHNRDAQQRENWGYTNRFDSDGLPTDPNHPFNRS